MCGVVACVLYHHKCRLFVGACCMSRVPELSAQEKGVEGLSLVAK